MKISQLILALGMGSVLIGSVSAAPLPANTISKKITLTAQINDALFVSKPDGSSWYGTEELDADDYKQQKFTKTLPVRIWTKNADFNASLAQPLKMSSGSYEMVDAKVTLSSAQGEKTLSFGAVQKITQIVSTADGYDEVHNVNISVSAPTKVGTLSTNGSYSGDLVMLFEPVAAAEPEKPAA
ncbi:fimbrial assembly protein [Pseudomonas sp. CCM 7893]|uniref:Fimbrial assembly protein n=1 Tax=Pseudomonas spelaei TaxID=1055469 RepID=A0A6I3W6Y8_9PSED|nr:fimbrial assembly protein [Pseudomonas spelaei]MUF03661.1 fimbrial assembly protein [Pseudomonas spelaei]